jgi:hypothetical protein
MTIYFYSVLSGHNAPSGTFTYGYGHIRLKKPIKTDEDLAKAFDIIYNQFSRETGIPSDKVSITALNPL